MNSPDPSSVFTANEARSTAVPTEDTRGVSPAGPGSSLMHLDSPGIHIPVEPCHNRAESEAVMSQSLFRQGGSYTTASARRV